MGQGLVGRETQGLNILQLGYGLQWKTFACICIRLCACVCLHTENLNVWMCLDAKGSLCPDTSFGQGLSGCTICSILLFTCSLCCDCVKD